MNIGIITDSMDGQITAIGRYTRELVYNLIKIYNPEKIFLIHSNKVKSRIYNSTREIVLRGLYSTNYPSLALINFYRSLALSRKYELDIIHYPDLRPDILFGFFKNFKIKKFKDIKVVSTFHDTSPLLFPQYHSIGEKIAYKFLVWLNKKMDSLITPSFSERKNVLHLLQVPPDRVFVTYLGVSEKFKPIKNKDEGRELLRNRYGIDESYILHVSKGFPRKNINRILHAFYILKKKYNIKNKLVLIGIRKRYLSQILNFIKLKNLQKEILIFPFINDNHLVLFYNLADVFVFPSIHEAFGLALVEAMKCATPIVTSNLFALPEITKGAAILVNPFDVNQIAKAIYKILSDESLKDELSKKAYIIAKNYSWIRTAKETLNVYKKTVREF